MKAFWKYAAEMLRYRTTVVLAIFGALISAGCFGAGIGTIPLIFKVMLENSETSAGKSLPELLTTLDQKLLGLIPDGLIAAAPSDRFQGVVVVLCGILVLTVIGATGKFIHGFCAMSAGIRAVADLRERSFRRIIHLPLKSVIEKGMADRMSRVVKDTNRLRSGFNALSTRAVGESLKGVAALGIAVALNWQLTLIAIVGAPILAVVIRKFSRRVQKASKRALRASGVMLGAMTEAVHGIRVVKVHTAENREDDRFQAINSRLMTEELSMRMAKALSSPVVELMSMVGVIAIAMLAAWYIISQDVSYTEVAATLIAVAAAGASVRPLTQISTEIHESAAAADRLLHLLSEPIELQSDTTLRPLSPHAECIEFDSVTFKYPCAERPALRDVSLKIRHGEMVAFVGPNGSGKTTLLSLIPRLFDPDQGTVRIDGTDLRKAQLKSIRDQIGVVTQETIVFHDTIANNIAYGTDHVSFDDIVSAARRAYADDFIRKKPAAYDTMIGEQGVTLSGGERQRLAIARAILRNPRILILDEATSMIDADSEALIAAALDEFCRHRTSLVIAHRLSTVINADRIVVMCEGAVEDIGTHMELLGRCALYQQLCRTQLVESDGSAPNERTPGDENRSPGVSNPADVVSARPSN